MDKIKVSNISQFNKRKEGTMIYAIILILLIMNWINKTLNNLEHQQQVLCYDLQILSKQIKEKENKIW